MIDIGYSEGLKVFSIWLGIGFLVGLIPLILLLKPIIAGKSYPRPAWIAFFSVFIIFFITAFPLFFARFHSISVDGEEWVLHYPLNKNIAIYPQSIRRLGTAEYDGQIPLWQGQFIVIDTEEGYRYLSVIIQDAQPAWKMLVTALSQFETNPTPSEPQKDSTKQDLLLVE